MSFYKAGHARCMMRHSPEKWMGTANIEARDLELLEADRLPFIEFTPKSPYVRKIFAKGEPGTEWVNMDWVVESNNEAMRMVSQAGGGLVGFPIGPQPHKDWQSMTVNVNVGGTLFSGFDWGYLSTAASNVRIFKGPPETCKKHTWDAMILRDCTTNTGNLNYHEPLGMRKWDILAFKCCEDFDHSWIVVCVKDVGAYSRSDGSCCCNIVN